MFIASPSICMLLQAPNTCWTCCICIWKDENVFQKYAIDIVGKYCPTEAPLILLGRLKPGISACKEGRYLIKHKMVLVQVNYFDCWNNLIQHFKHILLLADEPEKQLNNYFFLFFFIA